MKISVVSGGFDPIHSGHISYINAAKEYNGYINEGFTPQDAYLKTISGFAAKDLPKPEKLPMPATLTLTDMKQIINKNPDTAQNAFEKDLTQKYKNGVINMEEYKEGIKRLDFIFLSNLLPPLTLEINSVTL